MAVQSKMFDGAPFNGEAFEAERQAIMQEYGFNLAQMATAYNGSGGQRTGLSKWEEDAIAERLINAAGYTRQEFNALPNVRAVLGSAITTGGVAEANQIRDRVAREKEQYQSALNWMKTPEQRLEELVDYLEGRSDSYGSTPGMPQWEFESSYLQPIRENPENLKRFIEDVKTVQERQKDNPSFPQISEKEMAAKKLFAWQRGIDLNNTMEAFLGRGNFEKVEPERLTAKEMQLLGVVESPAGGYMTPEGKWYGEARILENIMGDDVVPTIVGNLRSGYGAVSGGSTGGGDLGGGSTGGGSTGGGSTGGGSTGGGRVTGGGGLVDTSSGLANTGGSPLGNGGVVYGPDGKTYSSPAAAIAAGILNYTFYRPVSPGGGTTSPAGNTGLIAGASQLGSGQVQLPNTMTGNTLPNTTGLANDQLFTSRPGIRLPTGVPNPFGV